MKRGVLILFLIQVLGLSSGFGQTVKLTVLHVNDTHGVGIANMTDQGDCLLSRAATIIKGVRKEVAAEGGHVLLLHGGDAFFEDHSKDTNDVIRRNNGPAEVIAMHHLGYDAMVLGNHEFDDTPRLKLLKDMNAFPMLSANVYHKDTTNYWATPYITTKAGKARVAIFGLSPGTNDAWNVTKGGRKYISVQDEHETVKTLVPELRKQADLVIAISHLGSKSDKTLTQYGMDLIVGGHFHERLNEGIRTNNTLIVQAQWHYKFVGRVDIELRERGEGYEVSSMKAKLIETARAEPDPEMSRLLVDLKKRIADKEDLTKWRPGNKRRSNF